MPSSPSSPRLTEHKLKCLTSQNSTTLIPSPVGEVLTTHHNHPPSPCSSSSSSTPGRSSSRRQGTRHLAPPAPHFLFTSDAPPSIASWAAHSVIGPHHHAHQSCSARPRTGISFRKDSSQLRQSSLSEPPTPVTLLQNDNSLSSTFSFPSSARPFPRAVSAHTFFASSTDRPTSLCTRAGGSYNGYDRKAVGNILSGIAASDATNKSSAATVMRVLERLRSSRPPLAAPLWRPASSRSCTQALVKRETIDSVNASIAGRHWPQHILRDLMIPPETLATIQVPRRSSSGFGLQAAARLQPHPLKERTGGEDFFFISEEAGAIGVADGVSEWKSFGVNPRLFAEELMLNCKEIANSSRHNGCSLHYNRAQDILRDGFEKVSAFGGSTATVACLDETGGPTLNTSP
eukprot:GHVS01048790.1.p1 GENE.GHVS01048790.1~~GHVS01048790.1.p1  ORF type:complete len:464 (-),score=97.00 GHVS01048790.1:16-1224(-)